MRDSRFLLTVIRRTLPGIDAFLNKILPNTSLTEEAEQLRLHYVTILGHEVTVPEHTLKSQHDLKLNEEVSETNTDDQELSLSGDPSCEVKGLDTDERAELWQESDDTSKVKFTLTSSVRPVADLYHPTVAICDSWIN